MTTNQTKLNLAIIPARGGSKRLENKNKLLLNDKPLVSHTIEAGLGSKNITDIIVSSDSDDILQIASSYENVTLHHREDSYAKDDSTALELVDHIFSNSEIEYEYITLMLPTCPLRTSSHIDEAFNLLKNEDDGIISVTSYNFPLELKVDIKDEYINLTNKSPLITGNTRSQNHKPSLRPNGGFYIAKWNSFYSNRNFWKGRVKYYKMNHEDSIDIDTQLDLETAEIIFRKKNINE
tara:strand:- start:78 stop:785 length:708 start_codon:yes stop_codon:yes gene_type:complete